MLGFGSMFLPESGLLGKPSRCRAVHACGKTSQSHKCCPRAVYAALLLSDRGSRLAHERREALKAGMRLACIDKAAEDAARNATASRARS